MKLEARSIKVQVLGYFALILTVLIFANLYLRGVVSDTTNVATTQVKEFEDLGKLTAIEHSYDQLDFWMMEMVDDGTNESYRRTEKQLSSFRDLLQTLPANYPDESIAIIAMTKEYEVLLPKVFVERQMGLSGGDNNVHFDELRSLNTELEQAIQGLEHKIELVTASGTKLLLNKTTYALTNSNLVTLLSLFIAGILFYAMVKGVLAPFGILVDKMKLIANGEENIEIPFQDRNDEIGDMAKNMLLFANNMKNGKLLVEAKNSNDAKQQEFKTGLLVNLSNIFETNINRLVKGLSETISNMNDTAFQLSHVASSSEGEAKKLNSLSSESANNVQTVAVATEELKASISEVKRQISNSAEISRGAVDQSENALRIVNQLNNASEKIGNILNTIREIAEQINLLALNATIEAARAGDAGKGFAVVASEVKNLANQTSKSADEIVNLIVNMQEQAVNTNDAIKSVTQTIRKVNDISVSLSNNFSEQDAAVHEIAKSALIASHDTQGFANTVESVTNAFGKTKDSAANLVHTSSDLSKCSKKLADEISNFLQEVKKA